MGILLISYLQLQSLLPPPIPANLLIDVSLYLAIILLVGLLLRSTMNTLNNALTQIQGTNSQLRALSSSLEDRVAARTLDITLAAEIGRRLAQQRDVDPLLNETITLIQDNFKLYHVQVYLTGADGQRLMLRAAAGLAGRELLQRNHNLPVGVGSINGMAALEKRPIVIPNVLENPLFRPNPLLPETRCEMAVPLLVRDQLIGTLNLQGNQINGLTAENLPAFETLAGQLATALDNATLFAQIRQSQALLAEQNRRLARESWQEYLNAINRQERLGYTYSLQGTTPQITDVLQTVHDSLIVTPIKVLDEPVGTIQIENAPNQPWSDQNALIIQAVADQVAQQIENLRLLDEAERFRAEAEGANRRLIREGWQAFEETTQIPAYVYDHVEVQAMAKMAAEEKTADHTFPLQIRGETIGTFNVSNISPNQENAHSIITTIADALSAHIENLRLTQVTQTALAQTEEQAYRLELLNQMSRQLTTASSQNEIVSVALQQTPGIIGADSAGLMLLAEDGRSFTAYIMQNNTVTQLHTPDGIQMSLAGTSAEIVFQEGDVMLIKDIRNSDKRDLQDMARFNIRSVIHAPLLIGSRTLGILTVMNRDEAAPFTERDANLLQQVSSVVATTMENQRLFEQATKRANRESIINTINQKVQGTTTIEAALEIATREIAQQLKARRATVEIGTTPNGH
ncbi:MAG: GAF domain-containing protein [Ardenticatenaceae bacterium]|nr:GAF domain-containing protein [Ardenticatenaceae bacterium]